MTLFVLNRQSDLNYSTLFKSVKRLRRCFVLKDAQVLALQAEFPGLSHLCSSLGGAQSTLGAGEFWEGWWPWLRVDSVGKELCCTP